jgi:hypothetical protein
VCRHEIMNKADKGESGQREEQTKLDSRIRRNFRYSTGMMANCGSKQPDRHVVQTYCFTIACTLQKHSFRS